MIEFIVKYWLEFLLGGIAAIIVGVFKYAWKGIKIHISDTISEECERITTKLLESKNDEDEAQNNNIAQLTNNIATLTHTVQQLEASVSKIESKFDQIDERMKAVENSQKNFSSELGEDFSDLKEGVLSIQAVSPEVAAAVTNVLEGVVSYGTATEAQPTVDQPVAGKTGTTNDTRDLWFVGYTPQVSVAVWVGYRTETEIWYQGSLGSTHTLPSPIFANFISEALKDEPRAEFPTADSPVYRDNYSWSFSKGTYVEPVYTVDDTDETSDSDSTSSTDGTSSDSGDGTSSNTDSSGQSDYSSDTEFTDV